MRMYKCNVVNLLSGRSWFQSSARFCISNQTRRSWSTRSGWSERADWFENAMHIINMMYVLSSLLLSRWAGCCRLGRWYPHLPRPRNRTSATMARWTWWWWLRQVTVRPWPAAGRTASGRVWEETCRTTRSLAVASESEEWTFMHNDYSHTHIYLYYIKRFTFVHN